MVADKCMFIGHRDVKLNAEQMENLKRVVEDLIMKEGVSTFYFSKTGGFDKIGHSIVSELKEKYPHIKRVCACGLYPTARDEYYEYLLQWYEESYFPEEVRGAGRNTHVKTNQHIINNVDILIAYYDQSYFLPHSNSGTRLAVEYAKSKKKDVRNYFGKL